MIGNPSYPAFPSQNFFSSEMDLYRTTSPFTESPFKMCMADTEDAFFSSAHTRQSGGTKIVAENNVSPSLVQEMIAFLDKNGNGIREVDENILFTYIVTIVVSKDSSYLKAAFDKTIPKHDEVCIFLEDNSTDFFSSRTTYILIGSDFQSELRKQQIGSIEQKFSEKYQVYFSENGNSYPLDYTGDEMQELITTGKLQTVSSKLLFGLLLVGNIQAIVMAPVYTALGSVILAGTKAIRDVIKFKEQHWDPEARIKDEATGEEKVNSDFQPILFPFSTKEIERLGEMGSDAIEKVTRRIKAQLKKEKEKLDTQLQQLGELGAFQYAGAEQIVSFLKKCAAVSSQLQDKLLGICEEIIPIFASLGIRWIYIVNAYFCGLWNSLLEAILGMVDLVGYLFSALGAAGEAIGEAKTLIPAALEMIDETIQKMSTINFSEIFSAALTEIVSQLSKIDLSAWVSSVSLEKVAYFIGGLTGFAVEILVGIFWSGGLDGVRAAVTKLGRIGEGFIDFIVAIVQKAAGASAGLSMVGLIKIGQLIMEALQKGADAVVAFIRYVFDALKRGFRTIEQMISEIKQIFKFTDADDQLIKDLGLTFTSLTQDTCTLCKI